MFDYWFFIIHSLWIITTIENRKNIIAYFGNLNSKKVFSYGIKFILGKKNEISKQNNLQDDLLLYKTIYSTNNNQSIEEKNKILNGRWNKEEQIRFIKGCFALWK